jgi:hypothetical protein
VSYSGTLRQGASSACAKSCNKISRSIKKAAVRWALRRRKQAVLYFLSPTLDSKDMEKILGSEPMCLK